MESCCDFNDPNAIYFADPWRGGAATCRGSKQYTIMLSWPRSRLSSVESTGRKILDIGLCNHMFLVISYVV